MPGITNPAEEYFKDGLWGWVTDQWKKLVATAGGALHVQFAGQEADVEVTQTAPADLTVGAHGWDGSAWRKQPMIWSFSEGYAERISDTVVTSGNAIAEGQEVSDPDEVWVLEFAGVRHDAGVGKYVIIRLWSNGTYADLYNESIDSGVRYYWKGRITLPPGGHVEAICVSPGDGKSVYLETWGYKMKIAE